MLTQPIEAIKIFPIPSDFGYVNIEIQSNRTAIYKGEIYNLSAQSISNENNHHKISFQVDEGTHIYRIHTHNLAPGNYQLRLFSDDGKMITTKKIVIL